MRKKKKDNVVLKVLFFIAYILLGWTIVVPLLASHLIFGSLFGKRVGETNDVENFEDYADIMVAENVKIMSGKNAISAYICRPKDESIRRNVIVVVSHGIGCSHKNYLNRAQFFVRKGYTALVFDMTGTVESEGKNIKGLPQSIIDMHNVYSFVESAEEFKDYKKLVYGHSWSGYASSAFLNYGHKPDAVASLSGFNSSTESAIEQATIYVGEMAVCCIWANKLYERIRFGKPASFTGIGGVNTYGGPILVSHSKDDPTVSYDISVCSHEAECTNPNAVFVAYEDRGHTLSRPIAVETQIVESLKGKPREVNAKKECIFKWKVDIHYKYVDTKTVFAIDEDYMETIYEFYENVLNKLN